MPLSRSLSLFIHPLARLTSTALSFSPHVTLWVGEEELTYKQQRTNPGNYDLQYSTWVNVFSCMPPLCNSKSLYFECENPKWGWWWWRRRRRRRRAIMLEHVQPLRAGGLIQDHRQSPPLWSQLTRAVFGEILQSLALSSAVFDFQRSIRAWTFFNNGSKFHIQHCTRRTTLFGARTFHLPTCFLNERPTPQTQGHF